MPKEVPPDLNIKRMNIIRKGFATIPEVSIFLNCSYSTARKVLEKMHKEAKAEKKKVMHNCVPIKRLLNYVDMTEKDIYRYAEMEFTMMHQGNVRRWKTNENYRSYKKSTS
ncbi:hypothetical protein MKC54_05100 [[Clostridium] innocuum]|nr:hypothetical protein [[Clostridium] innocuum]MCR0576257.1 hypothetical protein [[Clostridium] innocuum]